MKKTIRVTIEKEYEIELAPEVLTQEFVEAFEKGFWELEGEAIEDKIANLFEVAAYQIARGEHTFVEGIGPCATIIEAGYKKKLGQSFPVVYDELYDEAETEIV